jgi:hypothetical protein
MQKKSVGQRDKYENNILYPMGYVISCETGIESILNGKKYILHNSFLYDGLCKKALVLFLYYGQLIFIRDVLIV